MNTFQKQIDNEMNELNEHYDRQDQWTDGELKVACKWSDHIFIHGEVVSNKHILCIISDTQKDYIYKGKTYNKCRLYLPNENEVIPYNQEDINIMNYCRNDKFEEQFSSYEVPHCYLLGIVGAYDEDTIQDIYKHMLIHCQTVFKQVPQPLFEYRGINEEKEGMSNYYMICLSDLEEWINNYKRMVDKKELSF